MQDLVKRHGLELTLSQAGNGDDKFPQVKLGHFVPKVGFKPLRVPLAGDGTFTEDSWRNANILKKLIEERELVTCRECHQCPRYRQRRS